MSLWTLPSALADEDHVRIFSRSCASRVGGCLYFRGERIWWQEQPIVEGESGAREPGDDDRFAVAREWDGTGGAGKNKQ